MHARQSGWSRIQSGAGCSSIARNLSWLLLLVTATCVIITRAPNYCWLALELYISSTGRCPPGQTGWR